MGDAVILKMPKSYKSGQEKSNLPLQFNRLNRWQL
jgi:hypothetical protein